MKRQTTTIAILSALTMLASGCGVGPTGELQGSTEFELTTGGYEADAVVRAANESTYEQLDEHIGLDQRAATNIVQRRTLSGGITTLAELDAIPYVGDAALGKLLTWAAAQGFIGSCGDGVVQGQIEACDGGEGCTVDCKSTDSLLGAFVHGIQEGSYEGMAILSLANDATLAALDEDAALDSRAASGIVAARPIGDLQALDAAYFVGARAFGKLAAYASANGMIGACGDGSVAYPLETCDDSNNEAGDGCSADCRMENEPTGPPYHDTPVVHGIGDGSYDGIAILDVANTATQEELDVRIDLDARAAAGIVAARGDGFETLTALDAVPFVGASAFTKLLDYAITDAGVPFCGDGIVQPVEELCDGTAGCTADCTATWICGNGVAEAGEQCDDGNSYDGDTCRADCTFGVLEEVEDNMDLAWANDARGYFRISGSIAGDDHDWFQVRVDGALRIETTPEACGWDTYLELYDADENMVASDDDSGYLLCSSLVATDLPSGDYFLKVRQYSATGSGGDYTLALNF